MGKPVKITDADLKYLANALQENKPYTEMARHLDICVDTVKRILQREGLAEFEGAKYVIALSSEKHQKMWSRPCMKCKDARPRPKWQYICNKCKDKHKDDSIWDV